VVLPWSLFFPTFPLWLIDTEGVSDGRVKGGREEGRKEGREVEKCATHVSSTDREGAFFTLGVRWGAVVWHSYGLSTVLPSEYGNSRR